MDSNWSTHAQQAPSLIDNRCYYCSLTIMGMDSVLPCLVNFLIIFSKNINLVFKYRYWYIKVSRKIKLLFLSIPLYIFTLHSMVSWSMTLINVEHFYARKILSQFVFIQCSRFLYNRLFIHRCACYLDHNCKHWMEYSFLLSSMW